MNEEVARKDAKYAKTRQEGDGFLCAPLRTWRLCAQRFVFGVSHMSRFLLSCIFLTAAPALASAALDPQLTEPYRLDVVLHFAQHRLLTDVFKDGVERDLQDYLAVGFGDLAIVRVR